VDSSRDYEQRETDLPVFDDGVSSANSDLLVEAVPYEGYASQSLVKRRAKMDLRRARLRATRYSWECHQEHLVAIHGELVVPAVNNAAAASALAVTRCRPLAPAPLRPTASGSRPTPATSPPAASSPTACWPRRPEHSSSWHAQRAA
jgi:hypothetical protein